jgi:hypothetical protein
MSDLTRGRKEPKHIMLTDNEFKTRIKLLGESGHIFETWDKVIDELIMATYPWVNLRQARVLRCIIHVIWTIEFSNAYYSEVVFRLLLDEKELFPTKKTIAGTIKELSEKGVIKSKMVSAITYNRDGTILRKTRSRVIEVAEKFRTETIAAMSEVLQSSVSRFLSPEKKEYITSNEDGHDV